MTVALLAALVVVVLAAFVSLDFRASRAAVEHDAYRADAARWADALVHAHAEHTKALERVQDAHRTELLRVFADHRAEVQALCQRLQAPELAVIAHEQEKAGPDETMPLTDDEIAELQDRELAMERIERMQREGMLT